MGAWIVVGAHGFDGGAIDLLEWHEPRPAGSPPARASDAGFQRVGVDVSDLDSAIANASRHGGTIRDAPRTWSLAGDMPRRRAVVLDPDGFAVELVEGPATQLTFIAVTCADLERSVAFYRNLGFWKLGRSDHTDRSAHDDNTSGPIVDVVMGGPEDGYVQLLLSGFGTSPVRTAPPRPANTLGMWRMALLLPELDRAVAALRAGGIELLSDPQAMSMGPGVPELRFVCFRGPDHEVIEPIETPEGT